MNELREFDCEKRRGLSSEVKGLKHDAKRAPQRMFLRLLRLVRPSHLRILIQDSTGWSIQVSSLRHHLDETMAWLTRAQDSANGSGVAAGYSLLDGWLPPYPETTGYIIPTFFDYAAVTSQEEFRARAIRMADWEVTVQLPCGAVQAGVYRGESNPRIPAVFNTGQVILGWCRAYAETKNEVYLDAAQKAGDWLVSVQGVDGGWHHRGQETETVVHSYDVRTAWSLLELFQHVTKQSYMETAIRNLDWALSQQHENGWFDNNAFFVSSDKWNVPLTHTIAYVMEGFQEAWRILKDERYLRAVRKTSDQLQQIFQRSGILAGEFDCAWKSNATYSCVTGNAQIAGVWFRLYETTGDSRLLESAVKLNHCIKKTQNLFAQQAGIRGGVKGSHPIFGRYTPFIFVNWGAKFFADSLMLEERITGEPGEGKARIVQTLPKGIGGGIR